MLLLLPLPPAPVLPLPREQQQQQMTNPARLQPLVACVSVRSVQRAVLVVAVLLAPLVCRAQPVTLLVLRVCL